MATLSTLSAPAATIATGLVRFFDPRFITLSKMGKLLAIVLLLANLKVIPFFWHVSIRLSCSAYRIFFGGGGIIADEETLVYRLVSGMLYIYISCAERSNCPHLSIFLRLLSSHHVHHYTSVISTCTSQTQHSKYSRWFLFFPLLSLFPKMFQQLLSRLIVFY